MQDWRDIINLQRHWIGPCDGYAFHLLTSASNYLRIWTENPKYLKDQNAFVVLKNTHYLTKSADPKNLFVENPFTGKTMRAIFSDSAKFAEGCDVYLAAPTFEKNDEELGLSNGLNFTPSNAASTNVKAANADVLETAKRLKIGGYRVSAKLQDWLISRQRYWGTPIPMIHCEKCGTVPVPDEQLPVLLPGKNAKTDETLNCQCPSCGSKRAKREPDTMDTFVDSSWYYLRFLDPNNKEKIFDEKLVQRCMPVNLYIGGKEHAVLHLYYARFMNQFLYSQGLVPTPEPFSRLLVQGMVMGRSFKIKGSGRYIKETEVISFLQYYVQLLNNGIIIFFDRLK